MSVERSGASGWLLGFALLLCLFGVISVGFAIGAVVPAVGAVFDVDGGGVGGVLGGLAGALVWGGLGFLALKSWRRDNQRALVGASVAPPVLAEPVPLPDGPGLRSRWLVAVPLMVVAAVLPIFGHVTLITWHSLSFGDTLREIDGSRPTPSFWPELWEHVQNVGGALILPGIAVVVFLVRRNMFATWPKTCLWLAVWVLGPMTLISSALDDDDGVLPDIALSIGFIWLTYELGRLTTWVLSRPVAMDVVRSELEIPYPVPGSRARLRIRRDHVRLDRLKAGRGSLHRTIRWPELREARLDALDEPMTWKGSEQTRIEVPAGPVLRIAGGKEEWVLPVTEAMGEDLAAAITLRARDKT